MRYSIFLALIVLPVISAAQSVIEVTGDIVDGQSVAIAGHSFGSSNHLGPRIWDDLESGDFSPAWRSTNHLGLGSESRHSGSETCAAINFQGSGGDGGYGFVTAPSAVLAERWFVQYWFQLDENFDWGTSTYGGGDENLANVKIFRMWNPGSVDENFVIALHGFRNSAPYTSEYIDNDGGDYVFRGYMDDWSTGSWHCLQFEYKESSVLAQDGEIRIWLDGALQLDDRSIMTREDYSDLKRPYIVGFYDSWNDSGADRDDVFFDDIYIDDSWSRIEVGNAPIYNECTHREIQIPTSWADDMITFDMSTGGLAHTDDLYLFVVDQDGSRSPGFLIRGDGAADQGPPGPPGRPIRE